MRALLFVVGMMLMFTSASHAQGCPQEVPNGPPADSMPRTLTGRVVFHDDLRGWLSLQLDEPVCGEREIELFAGGGGSLEVDQGNSRQLEIFRDCRVTTTGVLGMGTTGYYSTSIYQNVDKLEPDGHCLRQPALPDYSRLRPDASVRTYHVRMWFDYAAPQGPVHATVTSGQRSLQPWQAYAHYWLTGGMVFYAYCAGGFHLKHLTATPSASPDMFDENTAMLDPEGASEKHVRRVWLTYSCSR